MSTIKSKQIQLGDSATASENVVIEVPLPQDGTFNIKRGDGTDVMTVGTDNKPDFAQGFKSQGQGISPFGRKNVVINGDCRVVQDVASKAFPSPSVGYGGPDTFYSENGGSAGGQFTQSQGNLTFDGVEKKTIRQTVDTPIVSTANSDFWFGISNRTEGLNCAHLNGKKLGLSFIFNSNVSGVFSCAIRVVNGGFNGSYLTSFEYTAGSPKKIEIEINEVPNDAVAANNLVSLIPTIGFLNSGNLNSSTTDQWQLGAFYTVPNFTNWGATAGNFIELTELQLEPNGVSSFETLSFGEQLALCQRYYEKSAGDGVVENQASSSNGAVHIGTVSSESGQLFHSVRFSVEKRSTPSMRFWDIGTGNGGVWQFRRNGVGNTSINVQPATGWTGTSGLLVSSDPTVGANYTPCIFFGHWVADARL